MRYDLHYRGENKLLIATTTATTATTAAAVMVATMLAAISLLASATPAWAGFAQGDQVTMGGQPVFAIPASAEGYSPNHRAWLTQDALDNALVRATDRSPAAVSVSKDNRAIVVRLAGRKVATADENSARMVGLTPKQLADEWASGIKSFLSDPSRTMAYVEELTGKNPINAEVAVVERRLFAPPGTVLPVAFACPLSSETMSAGEQIEGILIQEVAFGNYVIPAQSKVIGIINETVPGNYTIAFNTLITPNGTQLPIAAELTGTILTNVFPHLVATEGIPYGERFTYDSQVETACRIPAQIGIGTLGGGLGERLTFRHGSSLMIAAGTPMSVVFEHVTPIAVVLRSAQM